MESLVAARRGPLVLATVVLVAVCVGVVALPASLLEQIEKGRPLSGPQAGWAYRLIAIAALVQFAYGGFAIFRVDRVQAAKARDARFAARTPDSRIAGLARTAAAMVILTLVYGVATIAITGLRGGFWLFPLIAAAQAAWYYREIGQIARWEAFQLPAPVRDRSTGRWDPRYAGHVPALARGMTPRNGRGEGDAGDH